MLLTCHVREADGRIRSAESGAVWTNNSPNLLTMRDGIIHARGSTGTGYLTVTYQGQTAQLTVKIIPLADQINLSMLSTTLKVGSSASTQLYVFDSSKFYGQDYTVSWSVENPDILDLSASDAEGVHRARFTAKRAGTTYVLCQVSMADGSTAEERCYVHVS